MGRGKALPSRYRLGSDLRPWKCGGRVIGVNSEMDALPGVGHACGHNLIAIAGVAVALAIKTSLVEHNIPGKVVLLGTPGIYIHFFVWDDA